MIFPLFPALLKWYLPREAEGGLLDRLLHGILSLSPGSSVTDWQVIVLFGGILGSLYSLLQFASAPLWGSLSDTFGRRKLLLLTLTGTLCGYLIWGFSGSFLFLVLSRLVNGLMAGNLSVATAAIADITESKNRGKGMALIGIAFGLGFIIGPALGGMISRWDPTATWPGLKAYGINPFSAVAFFSALLACINITWVWRRFGETLPKEKRHAPDLKAASPLRPLRGSLPTEISKLALIYYCFILSFSGMEFTLTFLAGERMGYGPQGNALIFLYIGLILLLVQGVIVRRFAQSTGEWKLALTGLCCCLLGLLNMSLLHGHFFFYTGLTLLGTGMGLANPMLTSLVSLQSSESEQGKHLGVMRSCGSLARAMGPIAAALLYWQFGSTVAYLTGAVVMLPSILLMLSNRHTAGNATSPQA